MLGIGIGIPFTSGLSGYGGAGVTYSAEAATLFAAMSTPPNAARKALIDAFIVGLKTDGIWSKLDVLWVMAAADSQAAQLNWKTPASFTLTAVNSPTFTADRGFAKGTSGYLNPSWIPSSNGVNYTQNSASFGVWTRATTPTAAGVAIGAFNVATTSIASLVPNNGSAMDVIINEAATVASTATSGAGMYSVNRSAVSTTQYYKSGVAKGTGSGTTLANIDATFFILARNLSGSPNAATSDEIALAFAGNGTMSATDHANLNTRAQTYMTGVGA